MPVGRSSTAPPAQGRTGFFGFALVSGVGALAAGLVTLAGWVLNLPRLTDWTGAGVSMFPNTAVCTGACGLALIMLAGARSPTPAARSGVLALGLLVTTITVLTLLQHLTGVDLGIDTLLVRREWGQGAAASPMRMGPPASLSLALAGTAIVLLATSRARARAVAAGLGLTIVGIATLPLVGYLYGAEPLYTIPLITGIAMQTALVVFVIGLGLVALVPEHGVAPMFTGGSTAAITVRRLFLPMVVLIIGLGALVILGWDYQLYDREFGVAIRTVVEIVIVSALLRWAVVGVNKAEAARNQSEARLREALVQAERAGRMKDEFLATLSHELRTPMTAILGWIQMIRRSRPSAPSAPADDLATGLEVIERNARLQSRIIEDLLDMSRIISGKMKLTIGTLELGSVIQAAADVVRPSAEAKNVRLQVIGSTGDAPVRGDASRMQQVFYNLLSNAVKFTPKGGKIQIVTQCVESSVEVSVSDTGIGIRPEFLPHVFERFRQQDAGSTREHGGLGLGLAIVRHLVELHGGSVSAASDGPGRGATFTVRLPIALAAPLPQPGAEPRSRSGEHPPPAGGEPRVGQDVDLSGVQVLVVDDERDARDLLRRLLEQTRAGVLVAGSVAEAMTVLERTTPSVVVSDIGMPGEDGYSLIRRIRSLPPTGGGATPAIALTAFARSEDRTRAMHAGFDLHLAKPIDRDELLAGIVAVTRRGKPGAARAAPAAGSS